ncbi:hypothetical protein J6590_091931 [Homalodisca vitripennis]|nr:hypothetical protein J6590_094048 [Homalodisca vitripennis]KAG8299813.1 hypothetical protein J6590_091931 [Homalodisca vitripennis]
MFYSSPHLEFTALNLVYGDSRLRSGLRQEVRAKKPSKTLKLVTNGLKGTSKPPQLSGHAGLQGQYRSATLAPATLDVA